MRPVPPDRGWPDDWDERVAGRGCPMCATAGQMHSPDPVPEADLHAQAADLRALLAR